jgi:hypothetical protein
VAGAFLSDYHQTNIPNKSGSFLVLAMERDVGKGETLWLEGEKAVAPHWLPKQSHNVNVVAADTKRLFMIIIKRGVEWCLLSVFLALLTTAAMPQ